jgi:hypothetical protein
VVLITVVPENNETHEFFFARSLPKTNHLNLEMALTPLVYIRTWYFDEITVLPLEHLMIPAFSLASWYATTRAESLGIKEFELLRIHRVQVRELLADEIRRYLTIIRPSLPQQFAVSLGNQTILKAPIYSLFAPQVWMPISSSFYPKEI